MGKVQRHNVPKSPGGSVRSQAGVRIMARFPNESTCRDTCLSDLLFRNRRHTHSINVQVVCDSPTLITNVVAKYPESIHTGLLFQNNFCFLFLSLVTVARQ